MEFIILVVMFLVALGCEKVPEEEKTYAAARPAQRRVRRAVCQGKRLSKTA